MLTDVMEKALIRGIRRQQAARLVKERQLYRKGLKVLKEAYSPAGFNFIDKKYVTNYHQVGGLCLDEINKQYIKSTENLTPYDFSLKINFDTEEDTKSHECFDCGRNNEHLPTVTIQHQTCEFYTLKRVKSSVSCLIKNHISSAKFKLVHQPNGKDTKRYLKIIENNMK